MEELDVVIKVPEWGSIGRVVCVDKNKPGEVAYLNWMVRGDDLEIADLLIHEKSERQKGIGSRMVSALLSLAKDNGIQKVWGVTAVDDAPVHDFYKKHGFVFDSVVKDGCARFYQFLTTGSKYLVFKSPDGHVRKVAISKMVLKQRHYTQAPTTYHLMEMGELETDPDKAGLVGQISEGVYNDYKAQFPGTPITEKTTD